MQVVLLGEGWSPDRPGGLNRFFRALLEALRESGVNAEAVVVGPASDAPAGVVVAADAADPLPRRLRGISRAVREAELVDAHFALYAFPLLRRFRRTPLVVHFHGPWADESEARRGAKRRLERAVYRRARRLVTLSRANKRLLIERYGVDPWKVDVVPPGVDLERFSPGRRADARAALQIPEDTWVAVAARRLVPRMGLSVLLDAWERIDREPRLLLVVGDGPEREQLERRAGGPVRFLGEVADETLVECYRAADVAVVPSLRLEGFGLVVLEALACGTPVVVSDVGGLPEAIAGLAPASVVPAGDPAALAARLAEPLPEPEACRAHAERFTWKRTAEQTIGVYEHALHPPSRVRPRVVYLDHTARLSGAELHLVQLLRALEGDVEAHVILGEEGPLVERLLAAGVSVEVLRLAETARGLPRQRVGVRGALPAARSGLYALRLARRLRNLRPDLVHTNSLKASLYGGFAGRLAGVPVVWHLHDRIAEDYLPASAVRLVRAASHRLPSAAIANSRTTLSTLPGVRGGVVVPCIVDLDAPERPRGPVRTVGLIGRIARWKGQHVFLEAFARAFPDGPERAVVVGAPLFGVEEERYFEELRTLARSSGLNGRVEFTGFREDIAAELARLDVVVHASTTPEPFGQAVVEGLAAGVPVIAADAGGPAETIEHGVSGLLYPPGDAEALAQGLRRLASDDALRARLSEAGRERAAAFAPDQIASQVLEVYDGLIGR